MAALPFMPLYVADYLSDAAHLSTLEHGAYLLLIMTYWQKGESLPNDDKKLARIVRMGPREWAKARPVLSEFFEVTCDKWVHKRVEKELASVHDKSLKKRKAGLARAKQMYSKSSADAQPSYTDTYSTISKDMDADASSDKIFWTNAKAYLKPFVKGDPGALIGKWCRDHGKDEAARAITAAQLERVVEPISFITRCMKKAEPKNAWGDDWVNGPC